MNETLVKEYQQEVLKILKDLHNVDLEMATDYQKYDAVARVIMKDLVQKQQKTKATYFKKGARQLHYLSIEFLLGRLMSSNLLNLGALNEWKELLAAVGIDYASLEDVEKDAGTGNGGLGRLVACFMDSLATLRYPGHGYGIRYKYGLFSQEIINGEQVEVLDDWLQKGYPWEVKREEEAVYVKFGGYVESRSDGDRTHYVHHEKQLVKAVPYDIPIVGHGVNNVNTLRLWSAESPYDEVGTQVQSFAENDYSLEAISGRLYPDDTTFEGRVLRLKQQYFMVSATVQNIVRDFKKYYHDVRLMSDKVAIHINDTHPALAIPELMRILMDEEGLGWEQSWRLVVNMMAYTNHTILPEALEKWPVETMRSVLPRIYQIIEEINKRFCNQLWGYYPGDWDKISRMAIIANEEVYMAHLAIAGGHSINGVAALHSKILERETLNDFYRLSPHKFNNKTNGITHRRWLMLANPKLSNFATELIGSDYWKKDPDTLRLMLAYRKDTNVLDELGKIKQENKERLADFMYKQQGIVIDPNSRFDIQVKRIHMYKRQLMNALHVLHLYRELKANPKMQLDPVTFFFGGKAAPGYYLAKRVIKFINELAKTVNNDPVCKGRLQVVFIENFNVSKGQIVYPGADVSEQISLASKEASGTGNMKFMMNGAVTLGTWDGANVEIAERVGLNNIVIFGMRPEEVIEIERERGHRPWEYYHGDEYFHSLIDSMNDGTIARAGMFQDLKDDLIHHDTFMLLRDFKSYTLAHEKVQRLYRDKNHWNKMCLMNIGHSGHFSSDRTIREYAEDIWLLDPIRVDK